MFFFFKQKPAYELRISDWSSDVCSSDLGHRFVIHSEGWRRRPALMARAFSSDLRQRVVEAVDSGMSRRAAAGRFEIGISTAINWVRRWRETGNWAARRPGGRVRPPRIDAFGDEILGLVDQTPVMPLAEIADHLERTHEIGRGPVRTPVTHEHRVCLLLLE